uniref:Uncharacterized protein n=1 Tax=Picea sitchensis TaxID=3332 RepID=A0A6B9XTP6_PICSI|nr:hypothetical protein Q903MT_gene5477 [Picea sitchensis]
MVITLITALTYSRLIVCENQLTKLTLTPHRGNVALNLTNFLLLNCKCCKILSYHKGK